MLTKWILPVTDEVRMCSDGASYGNPGTGGCGVVFRTNEGGVLAVMVKNLQYTTTFFAECCAIVDGLGHAVELCTENLWVTSDLESALYAFLNDNVPWQLNFKWQRQKGSSAATDIELERLRSDCKKSLQIAQQWKKMYEDLHQFCVNELVDGGVTK
ncbi:hypothetical protein GIB67_016210 [Kingdonia uniflora]|uniref:RNase H type-1 domain-containing protein n=1 Tax=Kingdonia uniflora TaxID=39325 RepID=A0A7J7LSW3_9MAGN|nr:hypothetical protein GIB67_016210 [Kingdonia uniflora]